MRKPFLFTLAAMLLFPVLVPTRAQTPAGNELTLTQYLLLGSTGPQVASLQKFLNREPDTRVANSGPGSPGNETEYFGQLTHAAVIRFQEKFAQEILLPVGLERGNGRVGTYTRAKLNTIAASATADTPKAVPNAASTQSTAPQEYEVKETEKIDIYAGDAKIAAARQKMLESINAAITSSNTNSIAVPMPTTSQLPSVILQSLIPNAARPGTSVVLTASGVLANGVVYFGPTRIVRSISRSSTGVLSIVVPPISPGRYDVVIAQSGVPSNSVPFVVVDPRNPVVRIESITPATTTYSGTITITGSGFAPKGNVVITTYETYKDVSSSDGKTITLKLAPEMLKEAARIGDGTAAATIAVSVVNDYGFSNIDKKIVLTL